MRTLLALAVACLLVAAPSASAKAKPKPKPAPKPVCNLITDPEGDAQTLVYGHPELNQPDDPQMDILSVDIATDATRLTVVWRLAADPAPADPKWKLGRQYVLSGYAGDTLFTIHTLLSSTGNEFGDGKGTGVIDSKGDQIRTTVPLSALPASAAAPKASFHNLTAQTNTWIGTSNASPPWVGVAKPDQTAESAKPYIAGTPSCLKVGS